jgi:hypothetical protein
MQMRKIHNNLHAATRGSSSKSPKEQGVSTIVRTSQFFPCEDVFFLYTVSIPAQALLCNGKAYTPFLYKISYSMGKRLSTK